MAIIHQHLNWNDSENSLDFDSLEEFLGNHGGYVKFHPKTSYQQEISIHHIEHLSEHLGVTLTYVRTSEYPKRLHFLRISSASMLLIGEEAKVEELEKKINDLLGIKDKLALVELKDPHLGGSHHKSDDDYHLVSSYCVIGEGK